ncbi:hypothetical protein B296_00033047, partial [Ensete ventricosum]
QAANCLSEMEQSSEPSILDSIQSFLNAIAKKELLTHQDRDVKVLVATCACEATRITAPEAPYSDDVLRVGILLCYSKGLCAIRHLVTCCMMEKAMRFL